MVTRGRVKPLFIDLFLICLDKVKKLFNKARSLSSSYASGEGLRGEYLRIKKGAEAPWSLLELLVEMFGQPLAEGDDRPHHG
jgi:hypothetical protein